MKERPILCIAPMVRAILDGSKTQTRRVAKLTDTGRIKAVGSPRNWHPDDPNALIACPYGQPGDRLWVRESISATVCACGQDYCTGYIYRADGEPPTRLKWRPSIHMPRAASRITLEIVSVRVERLLDISEADARAEGVASVSEYFELWKSINGAAPSPENNPWVWVVEFKTIEVKK